MRRDGPPTSVLAAGQVPASQAGPPTTPQAGQVPAVLAERALAARRLIIDMAAGPRGCHLGGSLSVTDILIAALHRAGQDEGSRVVLSKGHAAAALYAALHVSGVLPQNPAPLYADPGHHFTGHPNHAVPGVLFPTGSLGHGLPYAAGWALARRLGGAAGIAVAVLGDGELQEGLVWEACQVAAAQRLGNLIVVVDRNGGQNDGPVDDISPLPNLLERFAAFGFETAEVDGHSPAELHAVFGAPRATDAPPLAVVARTVKGKGVRAVEGRANSHYVTIDAATAAKWKRFVK